MKKDIIKVSKPYLDVKTCASVVEKLIIFDSIITFSRGAHVINAKSILSLLSLKLKADEEIVITSIGVDEEISIEYIRQILT